MADQREAVEVQTLAVNAPTSKAVISAVKMDRILTNQTWEKAILTLAQIPTCQRSRGVVDVEDISIMKVLRVVTTCRVTINTAAKATDSLVTTVASAVLTEVEVAEVNSGITTAVVAVEVVISMRFHANRMIKKKASKSSNDQSEEELEAIVAVWACEAALQTKVMA